MKPDRDTVMKHMDRIREISDQGRQQRPSSAAVTALAYSLHNRYKEAGSSPTREELIHEATVTVLAKAGIEIDMDGAAAPVIVDRLL